MSNETLIVIFGSKVLDNFEPSGSLQRRIEGAFSCAQHHINVVFIGTGAVGENPPSEAAVISKQLQKLGIDSKSIIEESLSSDTLDSIFNCSRIIRSYANRKNVIVCSDRYHVLRCSVLFSLSGIKNTICWIPSGKSDNGKIKWYYMWMRDIVALFYDMLLLQIKLFKKN